MPDWLMHIILPLSRWLHIVATALLVGGTLFYEFVIPRAVEDLKEEQQMAVIGKVRWAFRLVVWFSAIVLLLSGSQQLARQWVYYTETQTAAAPWAAVHIATGLLAIFIALRVTTSHHVPVKPYRWMRINLVVLLVCAFFASTTRHVRLTLREEQDDRTRREIRLVTENAPTISPTTTTSQP